MSSRFELRLCGFLDLAVSVRKRAKTHLDKVDKIIDWKPIEGFLKKKLRRHKDALYCKPNTSKRHPDHLVYPYLLRGLTIDCPNQVWAADITYSAPGFRRWHGDAIRDSSMTGIQVGRARMRYCPPSALCCERARAEAAVTCCALAG